MLFKKLYLRFMNLTTFFNLNYEQIKAEGFDSKFLAFSDLKTYLDLHFKEKESAGKSFLGDDLYLLNTGAGSKKVFIWSQMHGNESTGTRAMLDVFNFLKNDNPFSNRIKSGTNIHYLPMLNPDGASRYTRRNACGIDLNRDFLMEASPEIKVLKRLVNRLNPDFLFNLHDQRTIFNVSGTKNPSSLAFLAPSANEHRNITPARKKSMEVIAGMAKELEVIIPGHIARFSDEFYPTSTGDNFMKAGFSNILFEAGHFPGDYERNEVRRFNALAVLLALDKIANPGEDESEYYFKIPENDKKALDMILRNVSMKSGSAESLVDIGIYFDEKPDLEQKKINLICRIDEIGDLSTSFGHREFDLNGAVYKGKTELYPTPGKTADFSVGHLVFENGKFMF